MHFNKELTDVKVICINLTTRNDRKKRMLLQAKNHRLDLKFHMAKPHKDPRRGCLESHLTVIGDAMAKGWKQLFILEDDAKIIRPITLLPTPPPNWDMLYLGGTIFNNFGVVEGYPEWSRVVTWTCHAYIINLANKRLIVDILAARSDNVSEIDEYFIKHIHRNYNVYMINPMRVIQRDGFSDIERKNVTYDFMEGTLAGFQQPEHEKTAKGEYILKLDFVPAEHLPMVSIITPTYNRRKIFDIAIANFNNFNYPADKLEWIIIDDSPDADLSVSDILPRDKRIVYMPVKLGGDAQERMSVAHKRNIGVNQARGEIIIHMDDDDYYPAESIMARVKILLKYRERGIECVGCSKIGVYDILNNKSSIATDGMISISEASMGYTKGFWSRQQFNELEREGEYKSFIRGRLQQIMDIPYSFVIYGLTHNTNFTGMAKRIDANVLTHRETGKPLNFYDEWDEEIQSIIDNIQNLLKKG